MRHWIDCMTPANNACQIVQCTPIKLEPRRWRDRIHLSFSIPVWYLTMLTVWSLGWGKYNSVGHNQGTLNFALVLCNYFFKYLCLSHVYLLVWYINSSILNIDNIMKKLYRFDPTGLLLCILWLSVNCIKNPSTGAEFWHIWELLQLFANIYPFCKLWRWTCSDLITQRDINPYLHCICPSALAPHLIGALYPSPIWSVSQLEFNQ